MKLPIEVNILVVGESRHAGKTTFMVRSLDILRWRNQSNIPHFRFGGIYFDMTSNMNEEDSQKRSESLRRFNDLADKLTGRNSEDNKRHWVPHTHVKSIFSFTVFMDSPDEPMPGQNRNPLIRFNWIDHPGAATLNTANYLDNDRFKEDLKDVDAVLIMRDAREVCSDDIDANNQIYHAFLNIMEAVSERNQNFGIRWPVPLCLIVTQSVRVAGKDMEMTQKVKKWMDLWQKNTIEDYPTRKKFGNLLTPKVASFITSAVETIEDKDKGRTHNDLPEVHESMPCRNTVEPILWLTAQILRAYRGTLGEVGRSYVSPVLLETAIMRLEEWAKFGRIKGRPIDLSPARFSKTNDRPLVFSGGIVKNADLEEN